MIKNQERKNFYLFKKDRIFKEKTLTTYYFRSNKIPVKKSGPFDINGERWKLNFETGEILSYKRKEVLLSRTASINHSKRLLSSLLLMNTFDWFATLTFDGQRIDRTNDKLVYDAYVKYINNLTHRFPNMGYVTVLERHKRDNCIHFHMLLNGISASQLGLVNSGKVCCHWAYHKDKICSKEYFDKTKNEHELTDTDGLPVYNATSFFYGFTTVTRIVSRERCNSYVQKYINKDIGKSTEIFRKRFFYSRNLLRPKVVDRVIGADFEQPVQLDKFLEFDKHVLKVNPDDIKYSETHNIFQYWEDNVVKDNIDFGLMPVNDEIIFK